MSYFTLVFLWCGGTVARSGGVSHVITKIDFLRYGAPLSRAWSSAIIKKIFDKIF